MSQQCRIRTAFAVSLLLAACAAQAAPASPLAEKAQQCAALVAGMAKDTRAIAAADDAATHVKIASHYNATLNRCFLLETVSGPARSPALRRILARETQRLADAYEKKDFGNYDSWGDGPPVTCWLQDKKCASRAEWVRLLKPLLEE